MVYQLTLVGCVTANNVYFLALHDGPNLCSTRYGATVLRHIKPLHLFLKLTRLCQFLFIYFFLQPFFKSRKSGQNHPSQLRGFQAQQVFQHSVEIPRCRVVTKVGDTVQAKCE